MSVILNTITSAGTLSKWKSILLAVVKFFGYCLLFPAMIYFFAEAADPYADYLVRAGNMMLFLGIFLLYLDQLVMYLQKIQHAQTHTN